MLTNKQVQMFESVARNHPQLREYLSAEFERNVQVLVKHNDDAQLRRAQGYAQCLQSLIAHIDGATPGSPSHRAGSST